MSMKLYDAYSSIRLSPLYILEIRSYTNHLFLFIAQKYFVVCIDHDVFIYRDCILHDKNRRLSQ